MARWRLTAAHYLKVPGTKYRYEETDRDSGEQNVAEFEVPRLLDPKDPPKQSRQFSGGEIIVSRGKGQRGDFVFEGDPTPDMEPLDDEAREISARFVEQWKHPIDSLGNEDYGTAILAKLEKQMAALLRGGAAVSPGSVGVSQEDFSALQAQVQALIEQNAALQEQLSAKGRRV